MTSWPQAPRSESWPNPANRTSPTATTARGPWASRTSPPARMICCGSTRLRAARGSRSAFPLQRATPYGISPRLAAAKWPSTFADLPKENDTVMKRRPKAICTAVVPCLALAVSAALARAEEAKHLHIGVVQFGLESTLQENSTKIVRLIRQAAASGARLVVFPEGALAAPHGTPPAEHAKALEAVRRAASATETPISGMP